MSNNDKLCVNNFGKICRTCLAEGEMKFIYEKCPEEVCLKEMLSAITFVQFSENDHLPVQICLNCVEEVSRAYRFAQNCLEVDRKLRNCFTEFDNKINNKAESEVLNSKTTENTEMQIKTEINIEEDNTIDFNPEIVFVKDEISYEDDDRDENVSHAQEECYENNDSDFLPTDELLSLNRKEIKYSKENCTICSKPILSNKMSQHLLIHSGEMSFSCEICGKGFSEKGRLTRHFKIHTGERSHKCSFCEKVFTQLVSLKMHLRTHTGDKPKPCLTISNNSFKKHKRIAISLDTKIKILNRLANGEGSTSVGKQFGLNEATVRTIKKNEAAIRESVVTGTKLSAKRYYQRENRKGTDIDTIDKRLLFRNNTNERNFSKPEGLKMSDNSLKKHKRIAISLDTKIKVLNRLASGEGSTSVGKQFGLNEASVRTIKKNEAAIRESVVSGTNLSAKTSSYTRDIVKEKMEKALILWIKDCSEKTIPINRVSIKQKALTIYQQIKDNESTQLNKNYIFPASNGWLMGFLRRYSLHKPSTHEESFVKKFF